MAVTLSNLSAITKEIYEGSLRKQLNDEVTTLRRIERSSNGITSTVGGKYVTFPIHYGRNGGIGARSEMEDLPAAGRQATAAAQIGLKYQYGSIALSGQTLELVDTNYQSFISALELETQGLKTDLAKNLNQQVYRDGSGTLATFTSTNSTTVTVGPEYIRNFTVGTIVDSYAGTALVNAGLTVTGVNSTTNQVTLDSTTGASVTSLVRAGSYGKEWTGLDKIVANSGTLYNINPSTVDVWKSVVDTSVSDRALTEGRIITNVDKVRENGGKTSVIFTTLGVRRAYFGLLVQQRQFLNTSRENKSFEGGFSGLAFTTDQGEVPIVTDVDCPKGTMWGLSEKNLKVYRDADWSFMSRDGNMWVRLPGSASGTWKDAYSATMFQYSELGTDRRNVHFKIDHLSEA